MYICQSQSPSSSHPPFPPWYPYVCSLHLCLYFCFTNKFICTIFADSTYKRYYMIFVFLFLCCAGFYLWAPSTIPTPFHALPCIVGVGKLGAIFPLFACWHGSRCGLGSSNEMRVPETKEEGNRNHFAFAGSSFGRCEILCRDFCISLTNLKLWRRHDLDRVLLRYPHLWVAIFIPSCNGKPES